MKNVIKIILFLWVGMSIFIVFFNSVKAVAEVKEWMFISEDAKKYKIFGDLHYFLKFIEKNTTKNSEIIILSKDVKTSYLGIYYLYPRKVINFNKKNEFENLINKDKPKYISAYDEKISFNDYYPIATYSSKFTNDFGEILKLK